MPYSDASGVEHPDSGPHNSGNKSSGRMNRRSPYSKPPDAFMCGERPKKHLLLNASCRLLSMEVGPLWCIHLSRLHFPENAHFIKTTMLLSTLLKSCKNGLQSMRGSRSSDWPPQSPDLNIIEHLWGYLVSKLRARFPPPSMISALETALHEEWLHIPLQVVHDLYASIPRRIKSVIQSKGGSNSLLIKLFSSFTGVRIILSPICI
ncbi:transposable element Tcb1 transposase [Trichonephila clavipes]|nr:transposable element Tcb1 transposase [Trichonephila clavipes]